MSKTSLLHPSSIFFWYASAQWREKHTSIDSFDSLATNYWFYRLLRFNTIITSKIGFSLFLKTQQLLIIFLVFIYWSSSVCAVIFKKYNHTLSCMFVGSIHIISLFFFLITHYSSIVRLCVSHAEPKKKLYSANQILYIYILNFQLFLCSYHYSIRVLIFRDNKLRVYLMISFGFVFVVSVQFRWPNFGSTRDDCEATWSGYGL